MGKKSIKPKFEQERNSFQLLPKNESQRLLIENLKTDTLVVASGSAGTGKTFCATAHAALELLNHRTDSIILTRPNVGMGNSLGFIPGTLEEKFSVWVAPMLSVLSAVMSKNVLDNQLRKGGVKLAPMEQMRGGSYEHSIVICDEVQNCTMDELKCLSTRIGEGSQLILCGDSSQHDMRGVSALEKFCEICVRHGVRDFSKVDFTRDDIVRSGLVKDLVIAFEKEGI